MSVAVIGGGAAGMMAAITAARLGEHVTLLERNEKVGRKLYITGKGRCNVTNHCPVQEVLEAVPRNARFLYSALSRMTPEDTERFFTDLGVPLKVERGNRVFPVSDRAADIVDALYRELRRRKVTIRQARVTAIRAADGVLTGLELESGEFLPCGAAVLATGGLSYPATGSTGDGYRIAAELGHTIVEPRASLVPLESPDSFCGRMQGLSLRNIRLTVRDERGKIAFWDQGEMLFTHFGLSGPLVLSASAHMRDFEKRTWTCHLDLKPALDEPTLDARLVRDLKDGANLDMSNRLGALLPRKMIPVFLEVCAIPGEKKARDVTREERRRMLERLKDFPVRVSGPRPVEEAIVTSGGIRVSEVNPRTMESRKVSGLFLAGEVLDVDAFTGGYNLQLAWATGRAAGEGAAAHGAEGA